MDTSDITDPAMTGLPEHTLLLRLRDRAGALEAIAATFAHRGISLCWTLGNDGATSPDGFATVIVHFRATDAHKEAVKRVLARLSRIVSVTEPALAGSAVRFCALVRLVADAPAPTLPDDPTGHVALITHDPETNEGIYSLTGSPESVGATITRLQARGHAKTVTQALLAL
jgi:acetolactate synthase small subunit